MTINESIYFLGRFHVLVLHLPVGVLMLAVGMEILARWPRFFVAGRSPLEAAMPIIWGAGALSAVLTVALGYMHASEPGFTGVGVDHHRWAGTALAFTAVLVWAWRADAPTSFAKAWPAGMLAITALLITTGHFGGVLTHGPDYLTEFAPGSLRTHRAVAGGPSRPKVTDFAKADVYLDVVAPLLASRCSACHNDDKRRGGLSFADYPSLRKGGESGEAIKPGDPAGSELYRRITLPSGADDYMPKNHKSPPSPAEIEVLRWWIAIGAPSQGLVGTLEPPQDVARDLKQVLGS
ncbi:MAG: c-type cytochrome domain-containing protein [Gammaproteobacteria bacterium]